MSEQSPHYVPGLSLTPEQIARRRSTIGASEIPVLAGVVPWTSPIALWREKVGLAPLAPFEGNEYTEWGTILEGPLREWYARKRGVTVVKPETSIIHPTEPWASCSPDGLLIEDPECGLECKCRGSHRADEWGEEGTDDIPFDVAIQTQWSMGVTGKSRWDVATLFGGNRARIYTTIRNEPLIADLFTIGRSFWQKYVLPNVQPPVDGSMATHEHLKLMYAKSVATRRPATDEEVWLLRQLKGLRAENKELEGRTLLVKNQLIDSMKEVEAVETPDGSWAKFATPGGSIISWKQVAEAMKATAEIIGKYSKPKQRQLDAYYKKGTTE